jgi:negative regulator of flagellin synthesis FlgM
MMRINGNIPIDDNKSSDKVSEIRKKQEIDNKDNANKTDDSKDRISLSGKAKEINELKRLISEMPDIRADRVDALRKAIDSGDYNIDAKKIAQRMLEEL